MQKFTGQELCPKDRTENPKRVLHTVGSCQMEPAEHLHLTCVMCKNEWVVAPADAQAG